MSKGTGLTPSQARTNSWFAYAGCVMAQTGVQLIALSLPLLRDDLGLSDREIALVMTFYLLPAAIGAIPIGILADRIGRRQVYGWSMIVFGAAALAVQLAAESFALILSVRFVQGLAFAGLLPMTMTILGDAFRGAELIRAQGRRSFAMLVGDGALPILGGALAAVTWRAPWLGQTLAIPFGLAVLYRMTDPPELIAKSKGRSIVTGFKKAFRQRGVAALQYFSFLRMFLKFSIFTFMPLLFVDVRGFSPVFAGILMGGSAIIGMVPSLGAGRIAAYGRATTFVGVGIFFEGVALAVWASVDSKTVILAAVVVFGLADGLSGVFSNAVVAAAPDTENRGSFIAATGALRNLAKFVGPAVTSLLILKFSLETTFTFLGLITVASTYFVVQLRGLDGRMQELADYDNVNVKENSGDEAAALATADTSTDHIQDPT
jgi:ACDE family multidrug resistance protein